MPQRDRENEETRVTELRDKVEQGVDFFRPLVQDAELTLAFLSGNQWVSSSQTRGLVPVGNETNEQRDTDNQMLNHYRRYMHYLFQDEPVITAAEGGNEVQDAERAKVASALLEHWNDNNGLKQAREEAAQWAAVSGIGYIVPSWQKDLRRVKRRTLQYNEDGVRNEDGQIRYVEEVEKEETRSDLLVESFCPLQVFPFPLMPSSWERVESVLTIDIVTFDWIKNNIKSDVDEDTLQAVQSHEVNMEAIKKINQFVSPEFGYMTDNPHGDNKYLVVQSFERPTKSRKDGRYMLMAGGQIMRDTKLPFVDEARAIDPLDRMNLSMGIIPVTPMKFPGRLIPPAPFGHDMRRAQVRINDLLTDMRQNRKTVGRNKLIYEEGQLDENQWTDEHGERVPIKPGGNITPTYYQGAPLQGIDWEFNLASNAFEQQSGQSPVMQGQNPTQVRSAFHADILREESMSLMYQVTDEQEETYEKLAKLLLEIARRRYSTERLIEIYGQDYMGHALNFATAKINPDIRVQRGSQRPRNKANIEAKLVELLQYGAFGQNAENIDQFWQMSELGTMNRAVDHDQKQKNRARNENSMMLRYEEVIQPWPHEDHDLHIEEHRGEMALPDWYAASDAVKQIMLSHIESHRELRAQQLAPEATMPTPEAMAGLGDNATGPGGGGGKGGQGASLDMAAQVAAQGSGEAVPQGAGAGAQTQTASAETGGNE